MPLALFSIILTVLGLCLFETISSIDNAVINAEVLRGMSQKGRKWFLLCGLLFAVFVIRGLLPWVIIWWTNPSWGFLGSFTATFNSDPAVAEAMEQSAPPTFSRRGDFSDSAAFPLVVYGTKNLWIAL